MLKSFEKLLLTFVFFFYYFHLFFVQGDPLFIGSFNQIDGSVYVVRSFDLLVALFFLFYIAFYLVPRILDQGQITRFILTLIIIYFSASLLEFLYDKLVMLLFNIPFDTNSFSDKELLYHQRRIINSSILPENLLLMGISLLYGLSRDWIKKFGTRQKFKREQLEAELKFLHSQINPHFLFNTLNDIYATALRNDDQITGDAILQLSSLMRYMLSDASKETTDLKSEINHIKDYLDLVRLRYSKNDPLSIRFNYPDTDDNINIAPLLLIPFIENAVKHGISIDGEGAISINLESANKKIVFSVKNMNYSSKNDFHKYSGIGLENVIKRLNLLYPEKHKLEIDNSGQEYLILLTIDTEM